MEKGSLTRNFPIGSTVIEFLVLTDILVMVKLVHKILTLVSISK